MRNWKILALIILSSFTLSACEDEAKRNTAEALLDADVQELSNTDAKALFEKGNAELQDKDYTDAIEIYSEVERLYPFTDYAILASQNTAYAQFADDDYDKALATIENFLTLHPGSEHVPYMMYLKGMSYFDQMSDIKRDNKFAALAKDNFKKLITRYPNHKYSQLAKEKLQQSHDNIAGKEMEVGRYYLKQKNFVAAQNRFKEVIEEHPNTGHYGEALYRMIEANIALGLTDRVQKYYSLLSSYPDSSWFNKATRIVK